MKIFIDRNYKCHVSSAEGLREFDVPFFDGKCKAFIDGYRYVPEGETWTREDGEVFEGEMTSPWKEHNILTAYQEQYEAMLEEMEDMRNALVNELGVNPNG